MLFYVKYTPSQARTLRETGEAPRTSALSHSGYESQIISPRDSSGNYTSNPENIERYSIISKEQQAKEIAIALKSETGVPANIIQSLAKTLGAAMEKITHKDAPTGITDTKRITGDDTIGGAGDLVRKVPAMIILLVLGIIAFIHIRKS